jgi:hypothetical protein
MAAGWSREAPTEVELEDGPVSDQGVSDSGTSDDHLAWAPGQPASDPEATLEQPPISADESPVGPASSSSIVVTLDDLADIPDDRQTATVVSPTVVHRCNACGSDLEASSGFCGRCGAIVSQQNPTAVAPPVNRPLTISPQHLSSPQATPLYPLNPFGPVRMPPRSTSGGAWKAVVALLVVGAVVLGIVFVPKIISALKGPTSTPALCNAYGAMVTESLSSSSFDNALFKDVGTLSDLASRYQQSVAVQAEAPLLSGVAKNGSTSVGELMADTTAIGDVCPNQASQWGRGLT